VRCVVKTVACDLRTVSNPPKQSTVKTDLIAISENTNINVLFSLLHPFIWP
jgi:hypothetical protein